MGARNISNAEWFERHMADLHRELARDKIIRARERKEHRLALRREAARKRKTETPSDAAAYNLRLLCTHKDEQKRAGKRRWWLDGELKSLLEWCEVIGTESGAVISPVELEDLLTNGLHHFKSVREIAVHVSA